MFDMIAPLFSSLRFLRTLQSLLIVISFTLPFMTGWFAYLVDNRIKEIEEPRAFTGAQQIQIIARLKTTTQLMIHINYPPGDREARDYAKDLYELLQHGQWMLYPPS